MGGISSPELLYKYNFVISSCHDVIELDIQSWTVLRSDIGIEGNTLFVCIEITQRRLREDTMQIILGNHFNHNYTISSDLYYYNLEYRADTVSHSLPGHNQYLWVKAEHGDFTEWNENNLHILNL